MIFFFSIARKIRPVENDEYDNVMKKIVNKLKRYVDESSSIESDSESNEEEKKFADQIKYIEKSEESNSNSNEEDDDIDKEDISSHFTDIGHDKVSQDSDKN